MMTRCLFIAVLLFNTCGSTCQAQRPLLIFSRTAPQGIKVLPAGYTTLSQHVIPRYANGRTYPAGQLLGWGPASVIRGNAETQNLSAGLRGVVVTEDYDQAIAQWQSDTAEKKAVLQAAVRDVTIAGHDETGTEYAGPGIISHQPAHWNKVTYEITGATNASPIAITSMHHSLPTGAQVTIAGVGGNTAANGTWTITKVDPDGAGALTVADGFSLDGSTGNGSYTGSGTWTADYWGDKYDGLLMRSSGLLVEGVNFFYIPGTALEIKKGGAGSHTGAKLAFDREKARVWNCKVNRAYRGFLISDVDAIVGGLEGSNLRDYGIKFHSGATQIDGALHFYGVGEGGGGDPGASVWFPNTGGASWGGPIYAEAAPIGMLIESSDNRLGPIFSKGCTEANIKILWGTGNELSAVDIEVRDGAVGVINSGQFNKILGGQFVLLSTASVGIHVTPSGGNTGHGLVIRDVQFIGASSTGGTAIKTDAVLNRCTISTHIQAVGTGIDLNPGGVSKIGNGNTISVTTFDVPTPINFPAGWSTTSTSTTNVITVNGVRWYPP